MGTGATGGLPTANRIINFSQQNPQDQDLEQQNLLSGKRRSEGGSRGFQTGGPGDLPFNEEFEVKREQLRKSEIQKNLMRFRLLAYSLTQFNPIKKNKFLERKRYMLTEKEATALQCTCDRATLRKNEDRNPHQSFNCGDSCLNRCVSAECCPWTCPCGPYCKNRRFQLHQDAYVYPVKTEHKGWGLLAGEFIKKGSFIMQYVGEIFSVDSELGQERVNLYKNSSCTYLMKTTNSEVIDPTFYGNIARFINHSCDPNCVTQKWNVLGEVCVGIFAIKDIKENEELTFDYQFDFFKTPFTKCYCGAAKCKGYLGVLATTNAQENPDMPKQISAPECGYCKKMILDNNSLIVCRGANKETYHISCVVKKESMKSGFAKNLNFKQFVCKVCRLSERRKANNDGINSDQEDNDNADMQANNALNEQASNRIPYPWESTNPDVLWYYEANEENKILDQIIEKEIETIEKMVQERSETQGSKKARKDPDSEFSPHYNFMSELQKKLKQRIKQQKSEKKKTSSYTEAKIKFRRHKELITKKEKTESNPPQKKTIKKKLKPSPQAKNQDQLNKNEQDQQDLANNLLLERKQRDGLHDVINQSNSEVMMLPIAITKNLITVEDHTFSDKSQPLKTIQDQDDSHRNESNKDEQEDIEEIEIDEELEEDQEEDVEDNEEMSSSEQSDEQEEVVSSSESEDEDDNQTSSERNSCSEGEQEEEENEELNLEDLQESQSEHDSEKEEEKVQTTRKYQKGPAGNKGIKKSKIISDQSSEEPVQKRPRGRPRTRIQNAVKQSKVSPKKASVNQRNQVLTEQATQKDQKLIEIQQLIQQKIDAFVKEQNYLIDSQIDDASETRESKFNVYEPVFNLAVPNFVDDYQCLPNFQIYWDPPWGGMVTIRLVSTFKQYNFFTQLLQWLTDLLFKQNILNGKSADHQSITTDHEPALHYPFEIIIVSVPKNFIRKLVGYQEKNLAHYRKLYTVDFDYSRDLLGDEFYQMNETTALRVFGSTRDVRIVNMLIQKELENMKIKTIFLQMSDCKIIMDHVKEVKVQVDPCEIRIKKMARDWKELRHPFFYLPNYFREMVLIGSQKEISNAEMIIDKFFTIKREQQVNVQQISYLLPISLKGYHISLRQELSRCFPNPPFQTFFYEPTFPRKHITVLMIGDWKMLLEAKTVLETEVNKLMIGTIDKNFETFQRFTFHQQLRFSFKSLKRFVLEKDIQYLGHWDMVSEYVENAGFQMSQLMSNQRMLGDIGFFGQQDEDVKDEKQKNLQTLIKYIKEDDIETCINSLFVLTDSKPDALERLMKNLCIQKRELIDMLAEILRRNYDAYKDAVQGGGRGGFSSYQFKPNNGNQFYGAPYSQFKNAPSGQGQIMMSNPAQNQTPSIMSDISSPNPKFFMQKRSRSRSKEIIALNQINSAPASFGMKSSSYQSVLPQTEKNSQPYTPLAQHQSSTSINRDQNYPINRYDDQPQKQNFYPERSKYSEKQDYNRYHHQDHSQSRDDQNRYHYSERSHHSRSKSNRERSQFKQTWNKESHHSVKQLPNANMDRSLHQQRDDYPYHRNQPTHDYYAQQRSPPRDRQRSPSPQYHRQYGNSLDNPDYQQHYGRKEDRDYHHNSQYVNRSRSNERRHHHRRYEEPPTSHYQHDQRRHYKHDQHYRQRSRSRNNNRYWQHGTAADRRSSPSHESAYYDRNPNILKNNHENRYNRSKSRGRNSRDRSHYQRHHNRRSKSRSQSYSRSRYAGYHESQQSQLQSGNQQDHKTRHYQQFVQYDPHLPQLSSPLHIPSIPSNSNNQGLSSPTSSGQRPFIVMPAQTQLPLSTIYVPLSTNQQQSLSQKYQAELHHSSSGGHSRAAASGVDSPVQYVQHHNQHQFNQSRQLQFQRAGSGNGSDPGHDGGQNNGSKKHPPSFMN